MAVLAKHVPEGERRIYLYAEHTVGRSPTCRLVLPRKSVSSFHACLRWHRGAWVVRDLGSRNGTYVNGQRVQDGSRALRVDDAVVFGDQSETWVFVDDSEPRALLIPVDAHAGGQALVIGELRAFPSDDDPRTTIFHDADGRYFIEGVEGEPAELDAEQRVSIGDVTYRLHLPGGGDGVLTTRTSAEAAVESSVRTMRLTLQVAPDEETAAAEIDAGAVQATLKPRVHLYLLLHLARLRVDQSEGGEAEAAGAGWVPVDVVCDHLRLTPEQLGLQVFRIRDDMKKIGISDAGEIVDRRRRGWIRIGVSARQISLGRL